MSDQDDKHPSWCAGEPMCTAYINEYPLGFHCGETERFEVPGLWVLLTLHQTHAYPPCKPKLTVVVGDSGIPHAGITLSMDDAWRFVDLMTSQLDQTRF